jgi:nitrogen regulatory protein P-II 1
MEKERWIYFDPVMSNIMKKIEATIQSSKVNILIDELNGVVKGFTITEGKGRGSGKRQNIRSSRGTISKTAEFNKVSVISTIVDDSIVERVSKIIEESIFSGGEEDGIIAISNIESVLNIGTKKKNSEAL